MVERKRHIGIDSFFTERQKLLNAYDEAKKQTSDDPVKTEHGVCGESEIRKWLRSFLPKRFDVCKGHIITVNPDFVGDLDEWDVLVYDAIESPILYVRGDGDNTEAKRAIPVEHVRAVIEVKATLSPSLSQKCAEKLLRLEQYLGVNTYAEYPTHLVNPFICAAVFFETKVETLKQYRQALDNLAAIYQREAGIPFMGALVLRSPRDPQHSGYLQAMHSNETIGFPDVAEMSSEFQYPDAKYGVFGTQIWNVNGYSTFLFDFLASIRGTRTASVSSFYGIDFHDTKGSRLFQ